MPTPPHPASTPLVFTQLVQEPLNDFLSASADTLDPLTQSVTRPLSHIFPFLLWQFWGNSLQAWLTAAAVFAAVYLSLFLIQRLATRHMKALSGFSPLMRGIFLLDVLEATQPFFILVLALYTAAQSLTLPVQMMHTLDRLPAMALFLQIAVWLSRFIDVWLTHYTQKRPDNSVHRSALVTGPLKVTCYVVVWFFCLILTLDNWGVHVTALLAGLGVGGVAVALALQSILVDVIGAIIIFIDKPFVIGDFLILDGGWMGVVETIGLRHVQILSLSGERLVISNSDLAKTRIRNYAPQKERRIVFNIDISPTTSLEKLNQIPELIKSVVKAQAKARLDRAHLARTTAISFQYEVVFFVLSGDYNLYMDIQQAIWFDVMEKLKVAEIAMAFLPSPTAEGQYFEQSLQPVS